MTPQEQAIALRAQASEHKRMAGWHRKRAREAMQALARLESEFGIRVEFITATGGTDGGEQHPQIRR